MQIQLPFFPEETKLINSSVGFRKQDGFIYYLHNGNPIYCHKEDDRQGYRFSLASLVSNHLCNIRELSEALGEHRKNIERYAKALDEKGASWFFARKETRGSCHKVTQEKQASIQEKLDRGYSKYRIAREEGVSESAITYHINKGNPVLKKKLNPSS
jgi:transposase